MDKAIVEKIFQSLLDHYWRCKTEGIGRSIEIYPKGFCISYGELVKLSGVPIQPRSIGVPLNAVAHTCQSNGWPPLNSLAVNRDSGMPGPGFETAPPGSESHPIDVNDWAGFVLACIDTSTFPKQAPTR